MTHPTLSSRHVTPIHCSHLRHKGMYVTGDAPAAEQDEFADRIEATAFWCACTQKAFGPDGQPVGPDHCGHGRACCDH
jgi:hypothetical protein